MFKEGLVSIIIPAHNSQDTIEECIKSILAQDFHNFEILIVINNSIDSTKTISEEFAEKDSRIRIIESEIGGVGHARNIGLKESTGEWILFVDSDDNLLPNGISTLLQSAEETNADFVCASYVLVNASTQKERNMILPTKVGISSVEGHKFFLTTGLNYSQPWAKLYKHELFKSISYPESGIYEDIYTIPKIVEQASSINVLSTPAYKYMQTPASISQTDDITRQLDGLNARLENYKYYSNEYPKYSQLAADAVIYFGYYLLGKTARSGIKENKDSFRKTVSIIKEVMPYASNHTYGMKVAKILFGFSPTMFAKLCQHFSLLKNGL